MGKSGRGRTGGEGCLERNLELETKNLCQKTDVSKAKLTVQILWKERGRSVAKMVKVNKPDPLQLI